MKLALVISALAVALTGCGGGGGGSGSSTSSVTSTNVTSAASISSTSAASSSHPFIPSLATGDFKGDGSTYVVLSGWAVGTTVPSVKIYKVDVTGATDSTTDILGGTFSLSVHYPLIADFNRDGIDDIFFSQRHVSIPNLGSFRSINLDKAVIELIKQLVVLFAQR